MNVALFDYGVGNLHSLAKALEAGGARVRIESDPAAALAADALVLPGVGAFSPAADRLAGGREAIRAALEDGFPCLGICLGMQLLFETSDEGPGRGLGVLPGRVRRLRARRVPQIGWNAARPVGASAAAAPREPSGPPDAPDPADPEASLDPPAHDGSSASPDSPPASGSRRPNAARARPDRVRLPDPLFACGGVPVVYYANSFVVEPDDPARVLAWTEYRGDRFPAAVRRGRCWGVQFHPEKSGAVGLRIIRGFLAAVGTDPTADARTAGEPDR